MGRKTQVIVSKAKRAAEMLKVFLPLVFTLFGGGAAYVGVTQTAPAPEDVKRMGDTVKELSSTVINVDKTLVKIDQKLSSVDESRARDRDELQRQINECLRAIDKLEAVSANKQETAELRRLVNELRERMATIEAKAK